MLTPFRVLSLLDHRSPHSSVTVTLHGLVGLGLLIGVPAAPSMTRVTLCVYRVPSCTRCRATPFSANLGSAA